MDWNQLFEMQKKLDSRIELEHGLSKEDLFSKKVLALFVELGELANETRCFKFWSQKPSSDKEVVLEEYVDVLHFIMSVGIDKGNMFYPASTIQDSDDDATSIFHIVIDNVHQYKHTPTQEMYDQLFRSFLKLGVVLGFSEQAIQDAYFEKNEINHQRQEEGY